MTFSISIDELLSRTALTDAQQPDERPPHFKTASDITKTCALCTKPGKACVGCVDAPQYEHGEDLQNTYYCSQECQTTDWDNHKEICYRKSLRKKLYRASEILDRIWHALREHTFDLRISKTIDIDGVFTIII